MVDNNQFRRTRGVRGFLGRELDQRMDWLARPPDMNPIEHAVSVGRGKDWNMSLHDSSCGHLDVDLELPVILH